MSYSSSDDHMNMFYFRLGIATLIQTNSLDSCPLKRSKCCVSTVAAVSEVGFDECILFEDTAISSLAKLSLCRAERRFGEGYAVL